MTADTIMADPTTATPITANDVFSASSLGAPENAVGFVLWRVVHRYVRELDRALSSLDLTHLQFTVLALAAWLARSSDVVTQTQLAHFGDIHPMQVSNVLKVLQAKNIIVRLADPADARAKIVIVTELGLHALKRALPIAVEVQTGMFGTAGLPDGVLLAELLKVESMPSV